MTRSARSGGDPGSGGGGPANGGLVLASLIAVAAVANLNLSVANVALPSIGLAFDASQTQLDLVAVGYSLGLAGSVLWLGALGDRYGRKLMIMLGIGLAIPASLRRGVRPVDRGPDPRADRGRRLRRHGLPDDARPHRRPVVRSRAHALDRPVVGDRRCHRRAAARSSSGFLLERFEWGSVFLVTLPLAVVALVMASRFVPAHVNEIERARRQPGRHPVRSSSSDR